MRRDAVSRRRSASSAPCCRVGCCGGSSRRCARARRMRRESHRTDRGVRERRARGRAVRVRTRRLGSARRRHDGPTFCARTAPRHMPRPRRGHLFEGVPLVVSCGAFSPRSSPASRTRRPAATLPRELRKLRGRAPATHADHGARDCSADVGRRGARVRDARVRGRIRARSGCTRWTARACAWSRAACTTVVVVGDDDAVRTCGKGARPPQLRAACVRGR